MVAGSDMLRGIPASSRQGRTSCLDETVISSEVSNFARELRARRMAIPLSGPTESINDTTLDNLGDCRRLCNPDGCQTCSRRSATGNQQWFAGARGCYLSRPDRSLRQRRDRSRRACAHHQRTRSKPYQQAHRSQVGHLPATGSQTRIQSKSGSENCQWPQKPEATFGVSCTASSRKPCSGN